MAEASDDNGPRKGRTGGGAGPVARARADVLRRYLAKEIRAEAARAELGVSRTYFFKLLAVWKAHRDMASLPAPKRNVEGLQSRPEQRRFIEDAADQIGDAVSIERVVQLLTDRYASLGMKAPSPPTLRTAVKDHRMRERKERHSLKDAFAIDVCAIDAPVIGEGAAVTTPLLFAAIVEQPGPPLEVMVIEDIPDPATAAILLSRLFAKAARGFFEETVATSLSEPALQIHMIRGDDAGWPDLLKAGRACGVELFGPITRKRTGRLLYQHLGRRFAGFALRPSATRKAPVNRPVRTTAVARDIRDIEADLRAGLPTGSTVPDADRLVLLECRAQAFAEFAAS